MSSLGQERVKMSKKRSRLQPDDQSDDSTARHGSSFFDASHAREEGMTSSVGSRSAMNDSDNSTITSCSSLQESEKEVTHVVEQTQQFMSEQWCEFERFAQGNNNEVQSATSLSIQSELKRLKALEKSLNWELSEAAVAMSGQQTEDIFDTRWREFEGSTSLSDSDVSSSEPSIRAELRRLKGLEEELFGLLKQAKVLITDPDSLKKSESWSESDNDTIRSATDYISRLHQKLAQTPDTKASSTEQLTSTDWYPSVRRASISTAELTSTEKLKQADTPSSPWLYGQATHSQSPKSPTTQHFTRGDLGSIVFDCDNSEISPSSSIAELSTTQNFTALKNKSSTQSNTLPRLDIASLAADSAVRREPPFAPRYSLKRRMEPYSVAVTSLLPEQFVKSGVLTPANLERRHAYESSSNFTGEGKNSIHPTIVVPDDDIPHKIHEVLLSAAGAPHVDSSALTTVSSASTPSNSSTAHIDDLQGLLDLEEELLSLVKQARVLLTDTSSESTRESSSTANESGKGESMISHEKAVELSPTEKNEGTRQSSPNCPPAVKVLPTSAIAGRDARRNMSTLEDIHAPANLVGPAPENECVSPVTTPHCLTDQAGKCRSGSAVVTPPSSFLIAPKGQFEDIVAEYDISKNSATRSAAETLDEVTNKDFLEKEAVGPQLIPIPNVARNYVSRPTAPPAIDPTTTASVRYPQSKLEDKFSEAEPANFESTSAEKAAVNIEPCATTSQEQPIVEPGSNGTTQGASNSASSSAARCKSLSDGKRGLALSKNVTVGAGNEVNTVSVSPTPSKHDIATPELDKDDKVRELWRREELVALFEGAEFKLAEDGGSEDRQEELLGDPSSPDKLADIAPAQSREVENILFHDEDRPPSTKESLGWEAACTNISHDTGQTNSSFETSCQNPCTERTSRLATPDDAVRSVTSFLAGGPDAASDQPPAALETGRRSQTGSTDFLDVLTKHRSQKAASSALNPTNKPTQQQKNRQARPACAAELASLTSPSVGKADTCSEQPCTISPLLTASDLQPENKLETDHANEDTKVIHSISVLLQSEKLPDDATDQAIVPPEHEVSNAPEDHRIVTDRLDAGEDSSGMQVSRFMSSSDPSRARTHAAPDIQNGMEAKSVFLPTALPICMQSTVSPASDPTLSTMTRPLNSAFSPPPSESEDAGQTFKSTMLPSTRCRLLMAPECKSTAATESGETRQLDDAQLKSGSMLEMLTQENVEDNVSQNHATGFDRNTTIAFSLTRSPLNVEDVVIDCHADTKVQRSNATMAEGVLKKKEDVPLEYIAEQGEQSNSHGEPARRFSTTQETTQQKFQVVSDDQHGSPDKSSIHPSSTSVSSRDEAESKEISHEIAALANCICQQTVIQVRLEAHAEGSLLSSLDPMPSPSRAPTKPRGAESSSDEAERSEDHIATFASVPSHESLVDQHKCDSLRLRTEAKTSSDVSETPGNRLAGSSSLQERLPAHDSLCNQKKAGLRLSPTDDLDASRPNRSKPRFHEPETCTQSPLSPISGIRGKESHHQCRQASSYPSDMLIGPDAKNEVRSAPAAEARTTSEATAVSSGAFTTAGADPRKRKTEDAKPVENDLSVNDQDPAASTTIISKTRRCSEKASELIFGQQQDPLKRLHESQASSIFKMPDSDAVLPSSSKLGATCLSVRRCGRSIPHERIATSDSRRGHDWVTLLSRLFFGHTLYKVNAIGSTQVFYRSYQGTTCVFLTSASTIYRLWHVIGAPELMLISIVLTWVEVKTPHSVDESRIAFFATLGAVGIQYLGLSSQRSQ